MPITTDQQIKGINFSEFAFRKILFISAISIVILLFCFFLTLVASSLPSINTIGIKFIYGVTWDPVSDKFGGFPFLAGTLFTSLLALIIAIPFSLSVALFLGEYFRTGLISAIFKNIVELLAAIPSVIYGFWGLFVLVPLIRSLETKIGVAPYGVGILTSSIILSIMIVPYAVSLTVQVITLVPADLKEAAYSLGATRLEVIRNIILPYTRSGIFAGILLALGRALGETMAVTMLIGNSHIVPVSIFSPGNTMASVIANEFTEATGKIYLSALIEMGLFLFLVTTIINIIGRSVIKRFSIS
ncbi:MAG: phosphate ABC transporter permease subunit PstC [Bacteroidia bacterium]|nr:phosphate ABC transporter permease subunit PstC [Bacteroidia bacterium]